MNWLTPLTGLILAAALIPPLIVLYFLKLRRKPQAISSTFLWQKSVEDLRANAPFQKLRRSLLLFLQLLALTLLALSVMQPQLQGGRQEGGKTVMLIDNSASMTSTNTVDGKDLTRLDEAKRRARERIETLYSGGLFTGGGGETMIVVFSDRAEIYSRFTSSKQQLLAAIDRIQPTHGETRIADALKLARAYTTNVVDPMGEARPTGDPPTLELYSDGRVADLKDQVLRGERLNYYAIGSKEADNVAFAGLSVERPYDRPSAVEVFASLLNFNQAEAICRIQLSVDGVARGIEETPVAAATVDPISGELNPGRANVVFSPFEQPRGAIIEVANLREDDLAADNVVQVVVPPPSRLKVALVSANPSRSIVLTALEGMKFESLEVLPPARYEQLAGEAGGAAADGVGGASAGAGIDRYDVIVFDDYQPIALPSSGGRYLSFGPTPPIEGLNDFGEGEQQVILSARDNHPSMRYVTYDNLFISKFRLLQPSDEVQVLMEGSRGPAIVAVSRGALQAIHVTFDPLESNWPFQRSFVTFIFNAVDYLGHAGEAITTEGLAPGEALTARLPAGATEIKLQMPDSAEPEPQQPLDPTQFAWGPIRVSGPYTLTWKAPGVDELQSRQFAVNLLSETEGRLDVTEVMEVGQETIDSRDPGDASYTPLWPWAIGICLAALMVEWWVYHRKAYI